MSPVDKPGSNIALGAGKLVLGLLVVMAMEGLYCSAANLTDTPSDILTTNWAMSPTRAGFTVMERTVGATLSEATVGAVCVLVPSFKPVVLAVLPTTLVRQDHR